MGFSGTIKIAKLSFGKQCPDPQKNTTIDDDAADECQKPKLSGSVNKQNSCSYCSLN